jgi:2-polyprenyl-6-methoxyphenol hydroxylase-like FAD-dependent oxidoreductase
VAQKHAEVVGAGLVGLSTALLLRKAGWSVTVHEQADAVREIGAGISLHQGACSVFEHLGLMERILAAGVDLDASQALSHTGEVLADRDLAGAYRQLAIRRQVLIKMLADEADARGVEVLTNSRATGATPDGVLSIAGKESRKADLVVGADGFHSAIRESLGLTGKKIQRSNGATRLLIDYDKASGRTVLEEWWGPANRMGILPMGDGKTYVYMSSRESDRRATRVPIDADYWGGLFPAIDKEIFRLLSQVQDPRHDRYPYVKPKSWSKGRVAIVGDALNAVPPSLGLGATLGLRNARLMVDALESDDSVPDALRAWEATARPDTEWIQRWSLFRERLSHNLPAPLARVRTKLLQRSNGLRGWGGRGRNFDEQLITGASR